MLPKPVLLVTLLVAAVSAHYGVPGIYENLPLEPTSTTPEASGDGSGNDDGFASGADAIAIDTDCSTKEDGLYAIGGCSPQFLTCSGGIARIMDCPADLIYDPRIVACEYSHNVPECGGVPQDVTSTQGYYPEVTEPEETTEAPTTTAAPYAPVETTPAEDVTAPAETSYAPVEEITTTAAPVNPYAAPVAVPSTPSNDDTRASNAERTCTGKPDGFYSFGDCSDHYTACSNGYLIPMQCPAQLAFDEARVICDYVINVPECQGGSGYGSVEETTTGEASGELPYMNNVYEESTTAVAEDVPSADEYAPVAAAYHAPYVPEETTTAADVPTIVYPPAEETTEPYVPEETTTAADEPSTTTEEVTIPYVEETTTAADEPTTTTVGYLPEVIETTPEPYVPEETTTEEVTTPEYVEETTTAADVPTTTEEVTTAAPYVPEETTTEEITTTEPYVPEETTTVEETTTEEITTAPYVPEETTPEVVETTTVEETTTEEATTAPYVPEETTPEVVETTTEEETTTAADEPSTTVGYYVPEETTPEVVEETTTEEVTTPEATTVADEPTTQAYEPASDSPQCVEGATAIEPCSQNYNNCVNGHEAVFVCEAGLFFSPEQGVCTSADQIAECHPASSTTVQYY